jgi:hypothetical protein
MAVSKDRAQSREGDFSAEIPCYRELTGNFVFFGMPDSGHFGWKARNSAIFQPDPARRNREFGFVKQGIRNHGTGNTKSNNREYEIAEQGIRNRFFCKKPDQSVSIALGMKRFSPSGHRGCACCASSPPSSS